MPFRPARRQRQHWVEPIQSLNRRLFIEAKHSRMLRRIQVQTDDVSRLGLKIRIVAGHIPFQSVGFQLGLGQNSLHRGLAERQLLGQFPAGPVRAAVRRLLLRSPDHAGLHLRRFLKPFAGDRNLAPNKRCQLDRVCQRLTDDLDDLLSAVGLKTAA